MKTDSAMQMPHTMIGLAVVVALAALYTLGKIIADGRQ